MSEKFLTEQSAVMKRE